MTDVSEYGFFQKTQKTSSLIRRGENKDAEASKKFLGNVGGASAIARSIRETEKFQVRAKPSWHSLLALYHVSIKKKKITSQPEDNSINISTVISVPNGSPQDREEHNEAGEERADAEKRDLKDLAEDIIVAHDSRVKIVGEIIDDTHRMMANFKTKREQMAMELQKLLTKGESLRKKDFERMMTDIIDAHAKREEEVKEMLESFRREEEEVQEKLRNLLKKGEEVRIKDFKKMMIEIKQGQEKRIQATNESVTNQLQRMQEEVHTMLDNFKTERQSVASAWHQMLGFLHQEKLEVQYKKRSNATVEKNNKEYEQKS